MKVLAVLLWPAGILVLAGVGALLARRAPAAVTTVPGSLPPAAIAPSRRYRAGTPPSVPGMPPTAASIARFAVIMLAGAVAILLVMILLGFLAAHAGPVIDKPIFRWTITHRIHLWYRFMRQTTKVGDTSITRAAAATAAVCLAVTYRTKRWLPVLGLGTLIVGNHFLSPLIHQTVSRTPPPGSGGTFPSGGAERAIVFYGLIAYLLWREFSASRRAAIWAGTAVAALGFHEGYCRGYLAVHWFTDIVGGWIYGTALLALFVAAVRIVAGPAGLRAGQGSATDGVQPRRTTTQEADSLS